MPTTKQNATFNDAAAPFRVTDARQAMPMLNKDSLYNYYIAQINQQKILMVTMEQQQEAIRAVQLNEAEVKNAQVTPQLSPDENEKIMNEITMLYEDGGLEEIRPHLSTIISVAHQCPFSGGEAVIKARILLLLIGDTTIYDDVTTCMQQGIYRQTIPQTQFQNEILIQPNPTNGEFEISNIYNVAKVKLYDIYSNELMTKQISKNAFHINLSLQPYKNGVYFVRLINFDGSTIVKPIILLK